MNPLYGVNQMASLRQRIRYERTHPAETCPPPIKPNDLPPCGPLDEDEPEPPPMPRGNPFTNLFGGGNS